MPVSVSWTQALAWRLERQLLDPVGAVSADDVVRRLGAVQAQVLSAAALAIRVRRAASGVDDVDDALVAGRLVRTWAMRGALHLLAPDTGPAFLALMAASRPWAKPAWDRYFGMTPRLWDAYRDAADEALAGRTLSREELIDAITAAPGLEHVGEGLRSSWGTMLKPLAWQGVLCLGPSRGGRATFRRPVDSGPAWTGLPEPDVAGSLAARAYFGAYGPATIRAYHRWLGTGWRGPRASLRRIVEDLGVPLAEVDLEGEAAYALKEHVEALGAARPSSAVRLLPGFDAWVLGPGTADDHVIPAARRRAVSRQAGWISPIVVVGGVVAGTWQLDGDRIAIASFDEVTRPAQVQLRKEVDRLARIVGRDLTLEVSSAPPA
ncbi:MAG TPA: crosslink repair DNA glycosylase YcaQ family protein [Candidatus Limnocylindrales bacterium]|nr:crosslink repair DNA glycosylase YcaQ family protein [Candidatus Limnocylindrales bacterium]